MKDFNPDITGTWNTECNVTPLIPIAAFPVDAVIRKYDSWGSWFGYLGTRFKYSVIKIPFLMPARPLKISEIVWVATCFYFPPIYNAMHTAF